jgi:hypothetical protein
MSTIQKVEKFQMTGLILDKKKTWKYHVLAEEKLDDNGT